MSTKTIEKVDVELCATKGRVNGALSTARNSSRSRCCKIRNGDVSVHISFCTPEFAQRPCHSAVSVEEKFLSVHRVIRYLTSGKLKGRRKC